MKIKGQSLIEFAIILMSVTIVAIISLQVINNRINSSVNQNIEIEEDVKGGETTEEDNCTKMGLHWDSANGICEAK